MAINVAVEIQDVQTIEEFEALLGAYEKHNPVKFAQKVANGEFDRVRAKLSGKKEAAGVKEDAPKRVSIKK